jgi:transposase InsO family protein
MKINLKTFPLFFYDWCIYFSNTIQIKLKSRTALEIEVIALRSQLALYQEQTLNHKISKPRPTPAFRQLWVIISKLWPDWKSFLMIIKPETVISWHRTAFRFYWARKSKHRGRPKISQATITLIKRIHKENPLWSPERIHDQLIHLGITDTPAPNTIAKYIKSSKKPPSENAGQSWKTFLTNHRKGIWSMDFLTVSTIYFKVLYVLVIVSHERRLIKHFAITNHPTSVWVANQLRNATPFGIQPEYLIHDNDCIFKSKDLQDFLANANITSVRTGYHSPWQNGICERTIGIIRRELLDHIIPFNEEHLRRLLGEYINQYYNPSRTHQGINRQTPIMPEEPVKTTVAETKLISVPVLGGLYRNYRKAA